jgi:hypothetical protein
MSCEFASEKKQSFTADLPVLRIIGSIQKAQLLFVFRAV